MKKLFVKLILRIFFRVKIEGWENWKATEGENVIVAPNYVSYIDPLILAMFLPETAPFAIERRLTQKRFANWFLPLAETHILDADSPMTLRYFLGLLKEGKRCIIFPELQPTITGNSMKVSAGVAHIAEHTGAKILPIQILGTQNTPFSRIQHKRGLKLFRRVVIRVFPAKEIKIPEEIKGSRRTAMAGRALEKIMEDAALYARRKEKKLFDNLIDARNEFGGNRRLFADLGSKPVTYNGFITRILLIQGLYRKQKFEGDVVGVLLPTSLAGVISLYALQNIGKIPSPLNFSIGGRALVSCCRTAQIKTVITAHTFIDKGKLSGLVDALVEAGIRIVWLDDIGKSITTGEKIAAALYAPFIKSAPVKEGETDKTALVLFTSGSEGAPKGVALSHKNLNTNHAQMFTRVEFYQSDRAMNAMPIFHSFGLSGVFMPVTLGFFVVFYPSPIAYKTIAAACYDERITIIFSTDTFLQGYAKAATNNYDFSSVRLLVQGGEKTRPATLEHWFNRFGIRITEGYGVTEASPVVANNYHAHFKAGSVGLFCSGIDYRLEPVEGVAKGGRLWLKGDNIMKGYIRATNPGVIEPPKDGWYDTGDIVDVDEDGFVTILGRAKRFAKIGGEMVSLASIEEVINEVWPEYHHAAVMTEGGSKGETLTLVTTSPDLQQRDVRAKLAEYGVAEIATPKKIICMEDMPVLATGKVAYPALEEKLKAIAEE